MEEQVKKLSWLRRLYHWTLSWVDHPSAKYALFFIALIESSIFPIPPDILLIALALGKPQSALRFAAIATAGSTLGAAVGYGIGFLLLASVGQPSRIFRAATICTAAARGSAIASGR